VRRRREERPAYRGSEAAQERLCERVALRIDPQQRRSVFEHAPGGCAKDGRGLSRPGRTERGHVLASSPRQPRRVVAGHRNVRLVFRPRPFADDLALRGDPDAFACSTRWRRLPRPSAVLLIATQFLAGAEIRLRRLVEGINSRGSRTPRCSSSATPGERPSHHA
jgi:hypothetical protein